MKKIVVVCLIFCLFLSACSAAEDPAVISLKTQVDALIAWKSRAQSSLDILRTDITALQSQRTSYNRDEVDTMIRKLKDDQSWIKTVAPVVPVTPVVSSPVIPSTGGATTPPPEGSLVWKYGTYQIDGTVQNIDFEGRRQTWKIIAVNTSSSYVRVIPQISFRLVNPQKNVYTSSGSSLMWDKEQNGEAFGPNGVLCGGKSNPALNMPMGIKISSSGLNNLSMSIVPDAVKDASGAYTNFTNFTPNCGGANGLGSVLVGPGRTVTWTLSATIDTHQNVDTNYSTGPWSMGVSFAADL